MQTLTSSPWPALLTWSSSPQAPAHRSYISAGRNPSQSHSRTLTQPSPLGKDLIPFPFPHLSSIALQTISLSPKHIHKILAKGEGHTTAFTSETSRPGVGNRGWGPFLLPQGSTHRRDARDMVTVLGWWGGHRGWGAWVGTASWRASACSSPVPPTLTLHQSWAGFRKPRGSTTGIKWGCMIRILIKGKILEICHIRNAVTINSDNTTLGK